MKAYCSWEAEEFPSSRKIKRCLIVKGLTEHEKDPRRYSKSSESHFKIWEDSDNIIAVRLLQWPV